MKPNMKPAYSDAILTPVIRIDIGCHLGIKNQIESPKDDQLKNHI